ncbi:MAG: hypothetical protein IJ426_05505 [Clostridia bacterium]|nr:hypothetical protein [Clostridia bacterium]
MSLYELGMEYLNQYRAVRERIKELKKQMRGLSKKQQYLYNCRILSLGEVAMSLKITGEHLVNYYGDRHE